MHRLLAVVVMVGCGGGSSQAPAATKPVPAEVVTTPAPPPPPPPPPPEPEKSGELVAIGGTGDDPCDGGELGSDPCAGGEATRGLGVRGTGAGGGGVGYGPSIGSVGTIGRGTGQGSGYGAGAPGRPRPADPKVTLGKHQVKGKLDTEIIRRVVRQRLNQIRYCYEKVLVQSPVLGGKLTLEFTITPDGTVAQAKATGVTPDLENCVAARVMTWQFPKPKSGVVQVTYPIVFAPTT